MSETGDGGTDTTKILLLALAAIIGIPIVLAVVVVIGGIILFVLTTVLSAILGSFVLGLGAEQAAAPQATFDFQADASGDVVVTHQAGDTMSASSVTVVVDGRVVGTWAELGDPGTVRPGDSIVIPDVRSGDSIRLIWEGPDGDTSVIGAYEVP